MSKKSSVKVGAQALEGEGIGELVSFADNREAGEALRLLSQTSENIFITGEAGTGKSTLLEYFRSSTEKNMVVLAPTGVAALNVGGQTIHSFCGFGPDITMSKVKRLSSWSPKKKLLSRLSTIVIDEISMVRADLLDCVDAFLRLNGPAHHLPFGGLQMVFVGDLFQLPPVEKDFVQTDGLLKIYDSPYFFDSIAFRGASFVRVTLSRVYRQQQGVFLEALNAVRTGAVSSEHLTLLNSRAHSEENEFTFEQFAMYLTATNARAKNINTFFLGRLPGSARVFTGSVAGDFTGRELPTELHLHVKIGAQVMLLNNDQKKRWVNGTMGRVVEFRSGEVSERPTSIDLSGDEVRYEYAEADQPKVRQAGVAGEVVVIELETGARVEVVPYTWELFKFVWNAQDKKVDSDTVGAFTQYPFKLAWAVTIHKAQGKTFNKVYIDLATGTFAHGQLYVALSRCRSLEGLYLRSPVSEKDIIVDPRVATFLNAQSSSPVTGA